MGQRTSGWVVVATVVVVLVTACGPGGPGRPAPGQVPTRGVPSSSVTPSLPPPPAPGGGVVRDSGAPLARPSGGAAGSLLPVDGGHLQLEDTGNGSTLTTLTGPAGTLAWVAPPRGGRVEVQADGSLTLHDEAGTVVAALGAPAGPDGGRGTWRPDGDVVALDAPAGSASFVVGAAALASATWGDADGGRSLLVVPAGWVRGGSLAAQHALVSQLGLAEPESASASMQAQLWCHVLGAPDKESWNVEPWRPEVRASTMLITRCNPDGDDR